MEGSSSLDKAVLKNSNKIPVRRIIMGFWACWIAQLGSAFTGLSVGGGTGGSWWNALVPGHLVTPLGREWGHLALQDHRDAQGTVQAFLITPRAWITLSQPPARAPQLRKGSNPAGMSSVIGSMQTQLGFRPLSSPSPVSTG